MSEYNIQMNKYNALNAGYDQLYPATKIENVDGLNTILQNKAPAGFGLGTISQIVTDFDTVKLNGWYFGAIGTAHAPDSVNEWSVRVTNLAHNSEVCVQDAYALTNVNKYLHRRRLVYINTATQDNPWEWVNPPMELGDEYRTTERYLGKPVYVKAIDFGTLPNTTKKHVSIDNQNHARAIRVSGLLNNGATIPGTDESQVSNEKPLQCYGYNNNVCIYAPYDASVKTAVVTVWYYKTTD